jgi:hypothetical protein
MNPELSSPSTGGSDALFDVAVNLSENGAAEAVSCSPSPRRSLFAELDCSDSVFGGAAAPTASATGFQSASASDADLKEEAAEDGEDESVDTMALLGVDAPKLSSRGVPMLPVHIELWTSFITDDIDALVVLGRALLVLSIDHIAPTRYLVCACPGALDMSACAAALMD